MSRAPCGGTRSSSERRKRERVALDVAGELTALSTRELDAQGDREGEQDNQRERDVGGDQAPRHVCAQAEANAAHGLDPARIAQLAAERGHVDVDGLGGEVVAPVPHLVEQPPARDDRAGTRRKCRQEIEFLGRQLDLLSAQQRAPRLAVDRQRADAEHRRGGSSLTRSTGDGVDASQELANAERLDQIVVGAELEAHDAVDLVSAGADDDDRHARAGAQLTAHLEAVAVGEAQVEQHEIVLGRRHAHPPRSRPR